MIAINMQLLIIAAALLGVLVKWSCCQEFGSPPLCLLNRLDVLPCRIVNTRRSNIPQDNEYAVYSTRIRGGPLRCEVRFRGSSLQSLPTVGGDPRIYYLFSPGFGRHNYGNQQLIRYRVQCPSDHFSFFNLMSLDLEPPSCSDDTGRTRCVDYLQVSIGGGDFGFLEVCGDITTNSLRSQIDSGTVEVVLRTSDMGRFPGFSATVVCVSTALLSRLDGGTSSATRIDDTGAPGKLEQFNARVRRRVDYVHRLRRSTEEEAKSQACSVDEANIPFDAGITYINRVVSIVDMDTMNVIRRLPAPINRLTVLDSSGSKQEFYREAPLTNGSITVFLGPGPLTRAGVFVFYTSFTTIPELGNISPQLVVPSGREAEVTASLLAGHLGQVLEGDDLLSQEELEPPTIDPGTLGLGRLQRARRVALDEPITCNYTDSELGLAILNRQTLNPVLTTVIDVITNCTDRVQPGRIKQVTASLPLDFRFSQEVVSVTEQTGTVIACVEIATDGTLPRNVVVRVVSQDGNATEPDDYSAVNTTVTFFNGTVRGGPGSQMCIDVEISKEGLVELDEVFQLTAHSLDPNVTIINNTTVIIVNSDEPVFRFTQDMFTACGEVTMVIELVSGTLGFPVGIIIAVDTVFNTTLTFPSDSSPNTQLNFSTILSGNSQILIAVATAAPLGLFQNSATVTLLSGNGESELYCTSFLRGSSSDDGFLGVELQNGPFRFLEQAYTSVFINSNGDVSLNRSFASLNIVPFPLSSSNPPVLAPFWADINPSAGGLVLYRETQDDLLLSRAANEVRTAFPDQPAFTPVLLFIATWLQVPPFGATGENTFQIVMATDGQISFVTFLYNDIQWTRAGRALAGINGGDGVRSVTLPGSRSEAIRNLTTTSNVGVPGVWMYRVDSSDIVTPP